MNKTIGVLLLVAFLSACVTINIYFPAAAAQEAADEIIDDVWQIKQDAESEAAAPEASAADENKTDSETPASN